MCPNTQCMNIGVQHWGEGRVDESVALNPATSVESVSDYVDLEMPLTIPCACMPGV